MSKNRNRAKLNKSQNGNEYRKIMLNIEYPIYWDEGLLFYPQYKRGFKNSNRSILRYQMRKYRTWKYNRLNQWKE